MPPLEGALLGVSGQLKSIVKHCKDDRANQKCNKPLESQTNYI